MNTTTETRVPSPETESIADQVEANLSPEVRAAHNEIARRQEQFPGVPVSFLGDHPFGEVVGAIAAVMAEIQPVEKGGKNTFHDYKYARMQDILQVLTPLMGKHGVVVFQYESARNMFDSDKVMAITYNFVVAHKSGQYWLQPVPQTGMSPCRTSKGTFDDKAFAKCHTSARKYFLLSLFQIPTEDESDPDNEQAQRTHSAPVPSPDGHVQPHKIVPLKKDTFEAWAGRYLDGLRTSKTDAELVAWDKLNDEALATMSNAEKGAPVYADIMKEFEALRVKFRDTAPVEVKPDPISTGPQQTVVPPAVNDPPQPFERPAGCPDADKDPDAFVTWAQKRMDGISYPTELSVVWEGEIGPASDGLFLPDCKALEEYYNKRLEKIGG